MQFLTDWPNRVKKYTLDCCDSKNKGYLLIEFASNTSLSEAAFVPWDIFHDII